MVFIKELVPLRIIVGIAQLLFNENYIARPMEGFWRQNEVEYRWREQGETLSVEAHFDAHDPQFVPEGSLASYITEHYYGYVRNMSPKGGFLTRVPEFYGNNTYKSRFVPNPRNGMSFDKNVIRYDYRLRVGGGGFETLKSYFDQQ